MDELCLCCVCGTTFQNSQALHLHVYSNHEADLQEDGPTTSGSPPLAHSSMFDDVDGRVPERITVRPDGSDEIDSCLPQDLRIRRSPSTKSRLSAHSPIPTTSFSSCGTAPPLLGHDDSRTCGSISDAVASGQSSTTEFHFEHLPSSQTHSPASKSYHCETCDKYFTKSCNLNSHIKAVHKGVRGFHCNECQKSFSRNSDLQKHIDAVHKGLRPYQCTTCQKRFSQKSSLKRHREAVHEGIKAFQCTHCGARFSYDVHLKRHIRAKHKIPPPNGHTDPETTDTKTASLPASPVFHPASLRQASI